MAFYTRTGRHLMVPFVFDDADKNPIVNGSRFAIAAKSAGNSAFPQVTPGRKPVC
jgi:hypothetical protein